MQQASINIKTILVLVALAVVALAVGAYVYNTMDPLKGRGADLQAYLSEEKTLCENWAERLQAAGIDGEDEYEKPQAAASACIAYPTGAIDQGHADKADIEQRVSRLQNESLGFRTWAKQKVQQNWSLEEKPEIDPVTMATEFLKLLSDQEQERRKAVKDSLEKSRFRSWHEIRKGKRGAMKE